MAGTVLVVCGVAWLAGALAAALALVPMDGVGLPVGAAARAACRGEGYWLDWLRTRGIWAALCVYLAEVVAYMFIPLPT